jgi:DNA polymerase-1
MLKKENYKCVLTIGEIENYIKGIENFKEKAIAFDFECSPLDKYRDEKDAALDVHKSDITGISLCISEASGIYIPLTHKIGYNAPHLKEVMDYLKKAVFENEDIIKIAHNIVYESAFLYKHGIVIQEPVYDTMAASQLTLKSGKEFRSLRDSGLKTLSKEIFNIDQVKYEEVTEGKYFDELNPKEEKTLHYACADSDYALRLYYKFNEWFENYIPKHKFICEKIESPAAVYTGIMKYNGIGVDENLMKIKLMEANKKLNDIRSSIFDFAGREISIGANASTKAFKDFLYNELSLPVLKTTEKSFQAADDEALILLKDWCKDKRPEVVLFIEKVQEYRKWSKIKSTYIDGFIKSINDSTGRIHADFFPMGTDTGRFSSRKPNLQNCPRKDNDPIGVRKFFKPKQGYVYLDFDFSQIELRVGAYFCRDKKMIQTYKNNGDIHGITTTLIYRIPFGEAVDKNSQHYKERRTIAKNCNFGVFFGLFPKGLQRTLRFKAGIEKSETECEEIIKSIKDGYSGLSTWQRETKKRAHIRKYAETALGRRRILKGINSDKWSEKSFWERCALNTPIQGTAADILKLAMGRIVKGLPKMPYIKPLLQIHDELLFEVRENKLNEAVEFIRDCMEKVPFKDFDVPIKAEGAVGRSFGELKEFD